MLGHIRGAALASIACLDMFTKLLILGCACAVTVAVPVGVYGGYGVGISPAAYASPYAAPAYAPAAYAAPAYAAPVIAKQVLPAAHVVAEPVDPNPAYTFSYGVADPSTGDQKDASETLENGVVHGSYSLVEPDGHLRRVTYTADKINGFNAVVERTGAASHGALAKVVAPAPVAVAAPVARYTLPGIAHPWG